MPFRTRETEQLGLTPKRLRHPQLAHPFHGVYATGLDLETHLGRCRAFEPLLLEGQFFSHTTALGLLGAPLPDLADDRIHVTVLHPRTPPRGRGVRGHSIRRFSTTMLHGLPVVDPASAWCQAAAVLTRDDLVAAGDFLLTGRRVLGVRGPSPVSRQQLERAARLHAGCAGSRAVAWALPRLRSGVDSRMESLLRLLLITSAGLPEPDVDVPVAVRGGLVLHADLAFAAERLVLEYEGDGHRVSRGQWLRDIERRELFEEAGHRVIRVTAPDIFSRPQHFIARVRRIRADRGAVSPARRD